MLAISQKTYSNIENGRSKIDIETLIKIAAIYKIEMTELLSQGNVNVQNNSSKDSSPTQGIIHNCNSEEHITQLYERINDLKTIIAHQDTIIELQKNELKLKDILLLN